MTLPFIFLMAYSKVEVYPAPGTYEEDHIAKRNARDSFDVRVGRLVEPNNAMNIAHLAFYANQVLEDLGMETCVVGFWHGLWEGRGNIQTVPDYLVKQ